MDDFFESSQFEKSSNLDEVQNRFFTSKKDLNNILYGIQYNSLNLLVCYIFGTILELIFPAYDSNKSNLKIVFEVVFQTIIISLIIHYVKKINKKIPFFMGDINNVNKHISLDVIISLVFIATQTNYIKKINHLSKKGLQFMKSKLKPKDDKKVNINKTKKEQIKKMVKHILYNESDKQNQMQGFNEINNLTNQIQEIKQQNIMQSNKIEQNSNMFPLPQQNGKFSNIQNNIEQFTGNNFHNNFPAPQMSNNQTNLNSQMDMARQSNGFRTNMNNNDLNNLFRSN